MKAFTFIILIISNHFFLQKYFVLNELEKEFKVNKYSLNTKELYGIDEEVEIYNVFLSNNKILLLTVFPNLELKKLEKIIHSNHHKWKIISYEKIKSNVLSKDQLLNQAHEWTFNPCLENKSTDYKIVKKVGNEYFEANFYLSEIYNIHSYSPPLMASFESLNINDKLHSIVEVMKSYKEQFPYETFPLDFRNGSLSKNVNHVYLKKYYLSKKFALKNQTAYQFWNFDGWWINDGLNNQRDADRILLIPDKNYRCIF